MGSLYASMNIAKSALLAQQYGLSVTGNNISNVNNPDYSIQSANQRATGTVAAGGNDYGTGVTVTNVSQSVDQLLENRLAKESSSHAAYEEAVSYIQILEGYFNQNSSSGLSGLLDNFWDSWDDLADNPKGSSERGLVYENGALLVDQVNTLSEQLTSLSHDLTSEIATGINTINDLAEKIAELNRKINTAEASGNANLLIDERNALIDNMAELINVEIINEGDGDITLATANGVPLVTGMQSYSLRMDGDEINWISSSGHEVEITDGITSGKLGGWLDVRDQSIATYQADLDELASGIIWGVNLIQSQGAGLNYYSGTLTGSYSVDDSGWLSSYAFGDNIDYSGDVTVWTEDTSSAASAFRKYMVDMGISTATISDWQGTAPGGKSGTYELTVVDAGDVGDKVVTESSGAYLAEVYGTSSGTAATALDNIFADQTITVANTKNGTETIEIADSGGDAIRSAADIAKALSAIDGVDAYASPNAASFDLTALSASASVNEGDTVKYTLYVDGIEYRQSFVVDPDKGTLAEQFEDSLVNSAKAINALNEDTDLYADGLTISSDKGATLGVQDFEVQDNAGVTLASFTDFNAGDTVELTIATVGGTPTTNTKVSVDLSGVTDPPTQQELAQAFYSALSQKLDSKTFAVALDTSTNAVSVRTLDGSNLIVKDPSGDTGNNATITMAAETGSTLAAGNLTLDFSVAGDSAQFDATDVNTDTIGFSMVSGGTSSTITEKGYAGVGATTAAAIMGTVTILTDEGITLTSSEKSDYGLFGTSGTATTGTSIITLGGTGGFGDWDVGDTISFEVDGQVVDITIPGPATDDYTLATLLATELNNDLTGTEYTIVQNGDSVSIIKNSTLDEEDPIEITNFKDDGAGGGGQASLAVSTGTGTGTHAPDNTTLSSGSGYKDAVTSSLYDDEAIIYWEKRDANGLLTGESGTITVTEEGTASIVENGKTTLSFNVSAGELVAGNTMTVNTDDKGQPDPLKFTVSRQANSVNDTYSFKVVSGGTLGADTITVEWSNGVTSGTIELEGQDPPFTPVTATVDGMTLTFTDGTLFDGDVFTITTDESGLARSSDADGIATGETASDWHWTLDSFADQFNRVAGGLTASVNSKNQLEIGASEHYHVIENVQYSGENGFSQENVSIEVLNYDALDFSAADLRFVRSNGSNGTWGIANDSTGGIARIIPTGGDDNGFQVDLNGDGVGDISINFNKPMEDGGYVEFDLIARDSTDINFAFGDENAKASGLLAAAGINTFFEGYNADTMGMNELMTNGDYIGAGIIDSHTGEIHEGDNANALALAGLQDKTLTMKEWTYIRGQAAHSTITETSLNGYHNGMVSALGLEASSFEASLKYAKLMMSQLAEQRNAVSAVSLDEEMVNLIKYQQGYSAASKLLTTADDMLSELLSIR